MNRILVCALLLTTGRAYPQFLMQSVNVTGEKEAHLEFTGSGNIPIPTQVVDDGIIELTFQGGEISDTAQGKLDLDSPHVLVRRISVYAPEKGVVKAKIVVNGTVENLKERFNYSRTEKGLQANIAYPKGNNATLNLLKEEQEPIKDLKVVTKTENAKIPYLQFVIVSLLLLSTAGGGLTVIRMLKKKGVISGSRKYLIEQLGHVALGQKAGVSLLRVGKEFVLVGVTQENVTFLSNLPRLQEQYEDETRFERGAFREAVQEEVDRMRVARA